MENKAQSSPRQNGDNIPSLVLVGGAPATGKTTLAHKIAREIPCPAICKDEIKQGLVHAAGVGKPVWGGPISSRAIRVFYKTVHDLLIAGISVVAEATFMRGRSEQDLLPLIAMARTRMLHCAIAPALVYERFVRRASEDVLKRVAHPDSEVIKALEEGTFSFEDFGPLELSIPTLTIDTTDGYNPSIESILDFINKA